MLSEFLRSNYAARIVQRSNIQVKDWIIHSNSISRRFGFDSYQSAVTFMKISADFLGNRGIDFKLNNVYNSVEVQIVGDATDNEIETANSINKLYYSSLHPVELLIKSDLSVYAFSDRLALKDNNQHVPTCFRLKSKDFFEDSNRALI